jgi:DNA-binding NtrC family response regulator
LKLDKCHEFFGTNVYLALLLEKEGARMTRKVRILIADGDEACLLALANFLRKMSYCCDCVESWTETLQMLQSRNYDLLVADSKIVSAKEFVDTVARVAPGLPIILMADPPVPDAAAGLLADPVMACLVKPMDYDSFEEQVRIAVEHSRLRRD